MKKLMAWKFVDRKVVPVFFTYTDIMSKSQFKKWLDKNHVKYVGIDEIEIDPSEREPIDKVGKINEKK